MITSLTQERSDVIH